MEEVKLYGFWASPFSYRVIWALKLKGVEYEYIEEDLWNKSEMLLNYNPVHKRIPVLVHNGKPISESSVILEYIEETWPNNPLLPTHPFEKAQARFWTKFVDDMGATFQKVILTEGEEQEKAGKEAKEKLRMIEEYAFIGEKKFFNGDKFGLTDIVAGWIATWLPHFDEASELKVFDQNSFPRLQAWIENFIEEDVIKENIPNHDEMLVYLKRLRVKDILPLGLSN